MQRTTKLIKVAIVFIFLLLGFINPSSATEDAIIAIVNDDVITLRDLEIYLRTVYVQLRLEGRSDSELQAIMSEMQEDGLNRLIEDKLILSEANQKGLEVNDVLIEAKIDKIKKRYPSEQIFLDSLLAEGATVTDLRNKVTDQLKVKYIVEQEVKSQIVVNPQEVTDYYKNHFEEFQKPERVDLDSIYISTTGDPSRAKEKATEALVQISAGKEFAQVAEDYSETGSIGLVEKGQTLPTIEKIIFKLEQGGISPMVEVKGGVYIFKLKEKLPTEISSLEEVKNVISNNLYKMKFQESFNIWLKELKEKAFIEIK